MVQKFEEFADEDAAEKNKVMARNGLKAYLYNLKNSINDTLEGKLFDKDKEFLSKSMDDALVWCKENPAAEESEYDEKQKEVEGIANTILKKAYKISSGGGESGSDDDFMGEDVDGVDDDGLSVESFCRRNGLTHILFIKRKSINRANSGFQNFIITVYYITLE